MASAATPDPAEPALPAAMAARLRALWQQRPLALTVALAALLRLVAALASRGFAFSDDHYEVVAVAQGWLDGGREWLGHPGAWRSLLYPGLHWAVFGALQAAGVADPQAKMLVVRLLHGAWSLLTVVYGYRLAGALAGPGAARLAGLLLAAFWYAPFIGVRDLAEVVCQPPLVATLWLAVRRPGGPHPRDLLAAGLWSGLAFALRFQAAIVPAALGGVLLVRREARSALALAAGFALAATALQGGSDWLGYGRPFSSLLAYVAFNADPRNVAQFPRGPWYQYLGTLAGVLIPPTSVLLLYGAARAARRAPQVLWPTLAFLVLHSAYPGKQERFLLPVLPLVLVLVAIGAEVLAAESAWVQRHRRVVRGLWTWFWAVNALLLVVFTTYYPKAARIEPLAFLHRQPDVRAVVVAPGEREPPRAPVFYLGKPVPVYLWPAGASVEDLAAQLRGGGAWPSYLLLSDDAHREERLAALGRLFPHLELVRSFRPSPLDWLLWRMNPRHNVNLTTRLYRIG
jgi:hypothetical protein